MSKLSKNKGKRGEKELTVLLSTLLGRIVVRRHAAGLANWEHMPQAFNDPQANDADIQSIPGLAIEVKRQETLNINSWWQQTERQADNLGAIPVLGFRQNRKKWQFCLPGYLLGIGVSGYILCDEKVFEDWLYIYLS